MYDDDHGCQSVKMPSCSERRAKLWDDITHQPYQSEVPCTKGGDLVGYIPSGFLLTYTSTGGPMSFHHRELSVEQWRREQGLHFSLMSWWLFQWCSRSKASCDEKSIHSVTMMVQQLLSSKQYAGRKEGGCWWLSNIQTRVVTTIEWRWYQHLLILTVTTPILPHIDDIRIDTMDNARMDTTQVDPAFDETHDWSCCILMLRLSTSHYHSDAVMMLQLGTTTARCSYIWWNLEKRLMSLPFTQCYSSGLIHWVTIWEVIVVLNLWLYTMACRRICSRTLWICSLMRCTPDSSWD